jgi:hypothetical protein
MEKILESEVSFGESCYSGRGRHYQDILARGQVIGCLIEREHSILAPIETTYQVCVSEDKAEKAQCWVDSEDKGYIMAQFDDFDKYLEFYNREVLGIPDKSLYVRESLFDFTE